ncbi:MAG: CapA family protein [Acetatifactor sp.]|nr:CapA family protein [Acetatifactor sp.]
MIEKSDLVFTGDIGFDRYMEGKWDDPELISGEVLDFLHSADHVIANVEGPILDWETNKTTSGAAQLLHTMNPGAVKVLKNMNADIWNINNNHICDAGEAGIEATVSEAKKAGAMTLGAGMNITEAKAPVILAEAGGIGIFSVGYQRACRPAGDDKAGCLSWSDFESICENIEFIKKEKKCRWCVLVAHAGEEFTPLPSPYTRERFLKFLDMGVDVIVTHHPHVPMNYERVGEKMIFYSLGNFIFDTPYQRSQFYTELGVVLKLKFTMESFSFEAAGIRIDRENERVVSEKLPDIFTEVNKEEYDLLKALSAKALVAATKRQLRFLKPDEYGDATEEKWHENFYEPMRSGRVPGETLDFQIIVPLAEEAEKGLWQKSNLKKVKEYIIRQI